MIERPKSGFWNNLLAVGRGIDLARRLVVNFFFLLLFFLFVALSLDDPAPTIGDAVVLDLQPVGILVDQLSGDPLDRALLSLSGDDVPEVLVQDLVDIVRAAKDDERVVALHLKLGSLVYGGLSKLQELGAVLGEFRASGKPILASADFYSKSQYYLAAHANEIWIHPMGMVTLDGYGRFSTYYKEGIDRLEVDWNVFRVGEYKTAVEPFLLDHMSENARHANREWLCDLWDSWIEDVAAARGVSQARLTDGVDRFGMYLEQADGQAAAMAWRLGLVDHLGHQDEVLDRLIELAGEEDEEGTYPSIDHTAYLETLNRDRSRSTGGGDIALIIASGTILDGWHAPGTIGGDSTAALIRQARRDEEVQAIVLRVDSGGGSAFASEVIRRELVLAQEAGKKVVVSMGSVAASGGYWIATASDEIWASPTTITGSIGIYAMIPTYQKPLERHFGARVDGLGTNWMAGAWRLDRPLDPRLGNAMQSMLEHNYRQFLEHVAEARNMGISEVDSIARGRVWSGEDAQALGLVDKLGGLDEAIASAARLAGIEGDPTVWLLEEQLDLSDELLLTMLAKAGDGFDLEGLGQRLRPQTSPFLSKVREQFEGQFDVFAQLDDPQGMYALCFCEVE
jgi:protease-4